MNPYTAERAWRVSKQLFTLARDLASEAGDDFNVAANEAITLARTLASLAANHRPTGDKLVGSGKE